MKTEVHDLPLSGYSIVRVYLTRAELKPKEPTEPATSHGVRFGWDWRRLEEKSAFEVKITLSVDAAQEHPHFISVDTVGRFRQIGDSPALDLEKFVSLQAVAILLPYARQYLTDLTVNTATGPYYLPSVNVVDLVKGFDLSKTTAAKEAVGHSAGSAMVSGRSATVSGRKMVGAVKRKR